MGQPAAEEEGEQGPLEPGGWRCYITNVIKEADVVRDFISRDKQSIALDWADVLRWEIEEVNPTVIFTVGNAATALMRALQTMEKIPWLRKPQPVMHYSNRGRGMTDKVVRETITNDIRMGLGYSS